MQKHQQSLFQALVLAVSPALADVYFAVERRMKNCNWLLPGLVNPDSCHFNVKPFFKWLMEERGMQRAW